VEGSDMFIIVDEEPAKVEIRPGGTASSVTMSFGRSKDVREHQAVIDNRSLMVDGDEDPWWTPGRFFQAVGELSRRGIVDEDGNHKLIKA